MENRDAHTPAPVHTTWYVLHALVCARAIPEVGVDRDQRGTDGTPSPIHRYPGNLYMNLRAVYVRPRDSRRGRLSGRRPGRRVGSVWIHRTHQGVAER